MVLAVSHQSRIIVRRRVYVDGSFASPVNFDGNGIGETACASADVNGDGIMDLYIGARSSNELILFIGDGDGGFTFSSKVKVGSGPWMITAGDVNGDGVPDVVSANSGSSNLSVVFADANGNLSAPVNYPTGSFPLAIDLGDIDGDGDLEVVTSNFSPLRIIQCMRMTEQVNI